MKKSICFYFQIHQPIYLEDYHFFKIGKSHHYFDEYYNSANIKRIAQNSYLPANKLALELIETYGVNFKISYSISGIALEQLELHAPEVIESFKELAKTGCVEFLAETYSHSLSSLSDTQEFENQVKMHSDKIFELFGQKPKAFRNSSLIYSDEIGDRVAKMGFDVMLTDGVKQVLGWKSPNFVYTNSINPRLKLLLKNSTLSDDISLRFKDSNWSEYPLTAEKYANWIDESCKDSDIVNLFMNYETIGEYVGGETGIFDFMRYLPKYLLAKDKYEIITPSEAAKKHQPIAPLNAPFPISWSDEERDITGWLGNELQKASFEELYKLSERLSKIDVKDIKDDFNRLQASDHFYYMATKLMSTGDSKHYISPYASPYEAFINYMNIISDLIIRVEEAENE